MALRAKSIEEVRAMNRFQRTEYFEEFAGYFWDSPQKPYAIRVGSTTMMSDDTMDLRQQFDHFIRYGKQRKVT
jgi:hypothetical protein